MLLFTKLNYKTRAFAFYIIQIFFLLLQQEALAQLLQPQPQEDPFLIILLIASATRTTRNKTINIFNIIISSLTRKGAQFYIRLELLPKRLSTGKQ